MANIWQQYGEGVVWQLMQCDFSGECTMTKYESVQRYALKQGFLKLAGWLADKPARYGDLYAEFCAEFNPRWLGQSAPNDSGVAAHAAQVAASPAPAKNRFGIREYNPDSPSQALVYGAKSG